MDEADYAQERDEFFRQQALQDHFRRSGKYQREAQTQYPGDDPLGNSGVGVSGSRICLDCGKAIGAARMKANPAAVRCVMCQAKTERSGRR